MPAAIPPAITTCPAHLDSILSAALARWERRGISHRIFQAEDALQEAASMCCSKSWDEPQTLLLAEFAYWMVKLTFDEETARRGRNKAAAAQAAAIGDLSAEEIEMIQKLRADAAAAAKKKGKR